MIALGWMSLGMDGSVCINNFRRKNVDPRNMDSKGGWNSSRNFRSCKLFGTNHNLRYYDGNEQGYADPGEEIVWLCHKTRLKTRMLLAYLMQIMLPRINYRLCHQKWACKDK